MVHEFCAYNVTILQNKKATFAAHWEDKSELSKFALFETDSYAVEHK